MCKTTKKVHVVYRCVCVCGHDGSPDSQVLFFSFPPAGPFIGSKRNTACPVVPRCHCDDDDLDLVCQYFDYDCTTTTTGTTPPKLRHGSRCQAGRQ